MVIQKIIWECRHCGWVEELFSVQEITRCPKCAHIDGLDLIDPPEIAAAYRIGGWEAVQDIRQQNEREAAEELVGRMRKNFGTWFRR